MLRHKAIHWKTNNAPGVTIVGGEIKEWPENLGEKPTEEQVLTWIAKYEAHIAIEKSAQEILAQEKQQVLTSNLPDWVKVKAAIDAAFPDQKQNTFMAKLTRVIYLFLKNSVD